MLCTINKSMRPGIGMETKLRGRKKDLTSLFCIALKCRLMLSIRRTINSPSAEIIDGLPRRSLVDITDGAICNFLSSPCLTFSKESFIAFAQTVCSWLRNLPEISVDFERRRVSTINFRATVEIFKGVSYTIIRKLYKANIDSSTICVWRITRNSQ